MLLEAVLLVGAITTILFLIAESKKPIVGLFASIMLMILSFWILGDGIQIHSGETHIDTNIGLEQGTANGTNDGSSVTAGATTTFNQDMKTNVTTNIIGSTNSSIAYTYANIPATPYITISALLGIMFLLLSLYLFFYYMFIIIGGWR